VPNETQKLRPLSANVPLASAKSEAIGVDSNSSSPTFLPSDEISIWMSEEMLRAENCKSSQSASTSKMISPFSETDSEKIFAKHLRFADENNSEDFICSVVEQLKEQVKHEIIREKPTIKKKPTKAKNKKKPKSIAELLEIIDSEIPIELKGAAKEKRVEKTDTQKNIREEKEKAEEIILEKIEVETKSRVETINPQEDKLGKFILNINSL